MWNSRKLYTTMKILNSVQPLHHLAQTFCPRPLSRVCSEHSLFPGDSRILECLLHRFHHFHFCRFMVSFGASYSTAPNHRVALACWNCGEPAPTAGPFIFCGSCIAVQPVDLSIDYFQIFGQEHRYEINGENLKAKHMEWQKKLHLVHSKSEKEKSYAEKQSARLFNAYRTLSKSIPRALYMLQLAGFVVDEEKTIADPELLAEMRNVQEVMEEASDTEDFLDIYSQIGKRHKRCSDFFSDALEKRDFESAVRAIQRMSYYQRVTQELLMEI